MLSLRWLSASLLAGLIACSAAPMPDDFNRRDNAESSDDDDDKDDEAETKSTPAPSGTSSSTPPNNSPPPDAGPPPATGPAGICDPAVAVPTACTSSAQGTTCSGLARCVADAGGTTGTWGACECGLVPVAITNSSDCSTVVCPASAPNVVGCSLTFGGDDARGCVARNATNLSAIFVKEGKSCSSGTVNGTLFCSPTPSTQPLNAMTCPMNKPTKLYVGTPSDCPD